MFAFSSFGNFGILARQRAQLFPLALVVLALPLAEAGASRFRERRGVTAGPVLVDASSPVPTRDRRGAPC
jgi:hypothetical protein